MAELNESAGVNASDALMREAQSVQQIASVINCLGQAKAAQDALNDIRMLGDQVSQVADILSSDAAEPSVEMHRLARVSLESVIPDLMDRVVTGDRIGMESLEQILSAVETTRGKLAQDNIDATLALTAALTGAIPVVAERVAETLRQLREKPSLVVTQFQDNDGLVRALSVNGSIPTDLEDYFKRYLAMGSTLLGMYGEVGFAGAMRTGEFTTALSGASKDTFWASVAAQVEAIGDPRKTLTEEQLELAMPGSGSLFGPAQAAIHIEDPIQRSIVEFCTSRTAQDPSLVAQMVQRNTESDAATVTAFAGLTQALEQLSKFLCQIDLRSYQDASSASWVTIERSAQDAQQFIANLPETVRQDLPDAAKLLTRYLSTLESLVRWPVLHYCVNLLLTSNALVLLAQRAMDPSAQDITEQVVAAKEEQEAKSDEGASETEEADDTEEANSEDEDGESDEEESEEEESEEAADDEESSETASDSATDDEQKEE